MMIFWSQFSNSRNSMFVNTQLVHLSSKKSSHRKREFTCTNNKTECSQDRNTEQAWSFFFLLLNMVMSFFKLLAPAWLWTHSHNNAWLNEKTRVAVRLTGLHYILHFLFFFLISLASSFIYSYPLSLSLFRRTGKQTNDWKHKRYSLFSPFSAFTYSYSFSLPFRNLNYASQAITNPKLIWCSNIRLD